jgi:hypothetical protein
MPKAKKTPEQKRLAKLKACARRIVRALTREV